MANWPEQGNGLAGPGIMSSDSEIFSKYWSWSGRKPEALTACERPSLSVESHSEPLLIKLLGVCYREVDPSLI